MAQTKPGELRGDAAFLLSEMKRAEQLHDDLLSCEAEIQRLDLKRAALLAEKPWLDADRSIALAAIDRDLAEAQAFHDETLAALLTP